MRFITGSAGESKKRISLTRFVSEDGERYDRERIVDAWAHTSYYIVNDNSQTSTSPPAYRDVAYALAEDPHLVERCETIVCPGPHIGHKYGRVAVDDLDDTVRYMLRDDVTDDDIVNRFPRLRIS
jgi:hypothetical protein